MPGLLLQDIVAQKLKIGSTYYRLGVLALGGGDLLVMPDDDVPVLDGRESMRDA